MELLPTRALQQCGIGTETRVLLALSGGADSTALLLLLHDAASDGRIGGVYAAYFHHGLRTAADEEERFCAALCERLNIPFYCGHGDVRSAADAAGDGLESAARKMRYAYLHDTMTAIGADCIATAHHADDQAETVLLHLLRGSGRRGLCGMQPRNGSIARPLLQVSHEALLSFLSERGQAYCTDETNDDSSFTRNRIRRELLPQLCTYNPRIRETLCGMAELLFQDERYLIERAERLLQEATADGGFRRERLLTAETPIRSRALIELLREHCGDDYRRTDEIALDTLLRAQAGSSIALRNGVQAWNDGAILRLGSRPKPQEYCFALPVGTEICADGWRVSVSYADGYRKPETDMEACLSLDAFDSGAESLFIRTKRDGDRFCPMGCGGTKLVSDVYADRKFSERMRQAPLLFSGEELLFVPGYTVAEAARVTKDSKTIIYFKVEEDAGE